MRILARSAHAAAIAATVAIAAAAAATAAAALLLPCRSWSTAEAPPHTVALQVGELKRRLPSQAVWLVALARVRAEVGGGSEPEGPQRSIFLRGTDWQHPSLCGVSCCGATRAGHLPCGRHGQGEHGVRRGREMATSIRETGADGCLPATTTPSAALAGGGAAVEIPIAPSFWVPSSSVSMPGRPACEPAASSVRLPSTNYSSAASTACAALVSAARRVTSTASSRNQ